MKVGTSTIPFASLVLTVGLTFCAARKTIYPRSDHFDGIRFHNTASAPEESFSDHARLLWELLSSRAKWPKNIEARQDKIPFPIVARGMRVIFIGHSTVLLQVNGLNILTDPVFSDRVGPNRLLSQRRVKSPGVLLRDIPNIDVILISHNHYGHLDLPSLKQITLQQRGKPPQIITGMGNRSLLEKHGLTNVDELDWGDTVRVGTVSIHFLEAVHTSRRSLLDTNKTLWGAFLIETPEGNIYFAGDSAYGKHYQRAFEEFGPVRLALLPIGAYKPRWFMYREHMDPFEAVHAHLDLHSTQSIAIHFQTFYAAAERYDESTTDLQTALRKLGVVSERFKVLGPGESMDIPQRPQS